MDATKLQLNLEKTKYYVREACKKISLDEYPEWVNVALELSDLGEDGRPLFHELSETSTKYDFTKTDNKFTNALKTRTGARGIGSFFQYCTDILHIPKYSTTKTGHCGFQNESHKVKFEKPVTGGELLLRKIETLPTLLDPILPKVGVVCVAGPSDVGKSTFLRQLCLHVVTGEERFIGFPIKSTHAKAIYASTEDDSNAISYLLNLQNKATGYTSEQLDGIRFIFQAENLQDNLAGLLEESPVDLVVVDCLTDLFGGKGSLNESTQVRSFLQPYAELAERHQCLFIFLHHTSKRSDDFEPNKRNLLGSQGIESKMRLVIELRIDKADPSLRHLCIVKGNYLPLEYKSESYILRFDDNMLFHSTGNRTPFEQLQMKSERSLEQREHLIEQVKELSGIGISQRKISQQLNISLGTVNNYLNSVHVQSNTRK